MKLLIIEDDKEIVDTIELILKLRWPDLSVVSEPTGKKGLELADIETPDFVIIDLGLPDVSGFDVLRKLRQFSNVPAIILTVRGEQADIVRGLELGADDYIVKPFAHMELVARVQAVMRRMGQGFESPITAGKLRFGPSLSKLNYNGRVISLTNIEGLLLYYLIKNHGEVIPYSALAEKIWGDDYPEVINNLRVFVRHLRNKLEVNPDRPKIVLNKVGVGYYLQPPV